MKFDAGILAAVILLALNLDGEAAEIVTDCPSTKPGDPLVRFQYGEEMERGSPGELDIPEEIHEKGGLTYTTTTYYFDGMDKEDLKKAALRCEYQDDSKLVFKIPGVLLRCGKIFREISPKSAKDEFLRVWCASEVEP